MLEALSPLLILVLEAALAALALFALITVLRIVRERPELESLLDQYSWLFEVVGDVVVRVAFHVTEEELAQYQLEAENTGRDIRLVIAYREVMQIAAEHGVEVDLNHVIGLVERRYQELKQQEIV